MATSFTLSELTRRAERGDAEAQFLVGDAWTRLLGVDELAVYWFRQAAKGGQREAHARLAELHSRDGVRRDAGEVFYRCVLGVLAGSRRALAMLPAANRCLSAEERSRVLRRIAWERLARGTRAASEA